MCVAIGIIRQCDDCIGFHVKAAIPPAPPARRSPKRSRSCIYMGGGPAYMYGVKALEAFDQLSA